MAKKLMRVRTPVWVLFLQLLVPWVAMGLIALGASALGAPGYAIFVLAIAGALGATYMVYRLEKERKKRFVRNRAQ